MKKIFESFHAAIQAAVELQVEHAKEGWHVVVEMTEFEITVTIFSSKKNFPVMKKGGDVLPYTWRTIHTFTKREHIISFYTCKYKFEWTKNSLT